MSKLSRDDILKLAKLARLRLTEDEVTKFQDEISSILGYVEMLNDVNTDGLKPTYQVNGLINVTRPDDVNDYGLTQLELLKNIPKLEKDYVKVKRMIG
jgi:aspartyl-tRNA(Asn)/glutamyl-tRNA(Gln) amidotransferase subunit C